MRRVGTISYVLAAIALFQVSSAQYLGQQCFTNNACLDNSKCSSGYCGGLFAACTEQTVAIDCQTGYRCLKGQCSDLVPATLGNACYTDQQCPGLSTCSPSELVCGGQDAMCKTEDGTGDGTSMDCASGYQCLSSHCTKRKPSVLGESCPPVALDTKSACAGTATCSEVDYTCGGLNAKCVAKDGSPTGPSVDCKTGLACLKGSCNTLVPVAFGAQCVSTSQCPGSSTCSTGVCGGVGSTCDVTDPSSACAPNLNCVANSCTLFGQVALGDTCLRDDQCPSGVRCSEDGLCGGTGSYCDSDASLCANGASCLRGYCSPLKLVESGGSCTSKVQCGTYQDCSPGGICGGLRAECYFAEDCHTGLECVNARCAARASQLGDPCTADGQCVRDPNTGNLPTCSLSSPSSICGGEGATCSGTTGFCASGYTCRDGACTNKNTGLCSPTSPCGNGLGCYSGVCGGLGAPCTPRPGLLSSADCADDYNCLGGRCTAKTSSEIGGTCNTNDQCPKDTTCGSEVCGGPTAECVAFDGSTDGESAQCAPGLKCLRGRCDPRSTQPLGGVCTVSEQCTDSACSNGICGGYLAYCDADGPQCSPGYTCNKEFKCMRRSVVPLGSTCVSYTECPTGVDCRGNICGGPTAQCQQDSQCMGGLICSAQGSCQVQPPQAVGEGCVNDAGCLGGTRCTRGICGGEGGYCADASACQAGLSCSSNKCSSLMPAGLGESCSVDEQCPRVATGQVACRDGRCGGYGAACTTVDGKYPGSSPQCRTDYTCLVGGFCSPRQAVPLGGRCGVDAECQNGVRCSQNTCGGPGSVCKGNQDCASALKCVESICVKEKVDVPLGHFCTDSTQCATGVACAPDGKCGGIGAACDPTKESCHSDYCDAFTMKCVSGASPKSEREGAGGSRRRDVARQSRIKASLCRSPMIACPVFPEGYECIDPMTNLEGCGGCVYGAVQGVDCTALPNVEGVDCQAGSCVIKSCVSGYTYQPHNRTCVYDLSA